MLDSTRNNPFSLQLVRSKHGVGLASTGLPVCEKGGLWAEGSVGRMAQQFMVQGALNRMLKRAMAGGWEKWQQVYADLKFANRAGGGAIRRMLNRKLSMAFEKWQFTAAELARQQFMMAGVMNRMLKRALSSAWERCSSQR